MSFDLAEEQLLVQDAARKFSDARLAPDAARREEEKSLDREALREAAALGFAAVTIGDDVGGAGLTRLDAALVFEQLARGDVATASFISIHNMASWMIDGFGADAQRRKWLPKLATMELIASYALTEPGAGSDAASLATKAARDGDDYVLDGAKAFISGAGFSDVYVVMARTGGEGAKGVSTFIVENGTPGLSFGAPEKKMGWTAQPTAIVNFEGCRVPAANRVNDEGMGFKIAMAGLDGGRINIAACSLGGAQAALDAASAYVKERRQFGRAIAAFQNTQFTIADMATDLEASRLMVYRAARALDAKDPAASRHCAMAKRFATDACWEIVDKALQLHGGYGYLRDYPIERILRDLRVHRILEGTNEIMRVIIARDLLGGQPPNGR